MSALANLPEFLLVVGFGLVPGVTRMVALGHNSDVDSASLPEDIWAEGGAYPWMTGATSLEMVSNNAADASAGTGARTVVVTGLDVNYVQISEVVTLNGITAVPLVNQYFRINQMRVASAGSLEANAGTLTLRNTGAGTTRAIIGMISGKGAGITRQAQYTVPAGFTLQIISQYVAINGNGTSRSCDVSNYIRSPAGVVVRPLTLTASDGKPYRHDAIPGIQVNEKTDYSLQVTSVSGDNLDVTGALLAVQRRNT